MRHFQKIVGLMAVAMVLVLSGCTKSNKLLKHIPADTDVVTVIDANAILESAGGSVSDGKINLPDYVTQYLPAAGKAKLEPILNSGAVDISNIVFAGNYSDKQPVVVLSVRNREAFLKILTDNGARESQTKGDIDIYLLDGNEIALGKDFALIGAGGEVYGVLHRAESSDFASTDYAKHLNGHVVAVSADLAKIIANDTDLSKLSLPAEFTNSRIIAFADLTTDELKARMELVNTKGKVLKFTDMMPEGVDFKPSTISKKALEFLNQNEMLVYAVSLKDVNWDKYLETLSSQMPAEAAMGVTIAGAYLENIDGTVAVGVGPAQGVGVMQLLTGSNSDLMKNISVTAVVEMKDGKAKEMLKQLSGLAASMNLPIADNGDKITLNMGATSISAYAKDDFMVVTTSGMQPGNNPTVAAFDWGRWGGGFGLAAGNSLLNGFGLNGYDAQAAIYADDFSGVNMTLKVTGGAEKGLIERIAKAALKAANSIQ